MSLACSASFILMCFSPASPQAANGGTPPVAETIASHLGRQAPVYRPGLTPTGLGWGSDTQAYPERFVINPKDGAELAWVPPGEFMMGEESGRPEERPVHRVRFTRGFWMYRHPVTNAQFRQCRPNHDSGQYEGLSLRGDQYPVARVNWEECRAYAEWAGAALPTEAQWEYACRAGSTTRFWWGDSETEAGKYANVGDRASQREWPWWVVFDTDDGYAASSPVGSYAPNPFGLLDMIGNVWQWCADWFAADYYQNSPTDDPTGPATGQHRVIRGGSWDCYPAHSRSAYRNWLIPPEHRYPWLGFRCVITNG